MRGLMVVMVLVLMGCGSEAPPAPEPYCTSDWQTHCADGYMPICVWSDGRLVEVAPCQTDGMGGLAPSCLSPDGIVPICIQSMSAEDAGM